MGRNSSSGVRKALRARRVREASWQVPIVDSATLEAAVETLSEARGALTLAGMGDADQEVVDKFREQVKAAQKAVDECFSTIRFKGLPADEFEALKADHPATDAEVADEQEVHLDTFLPALCAACALDSDLTAEEWAEEVKQMTAGERNELLAVVTFVNTRSWSAVIPKG